MFCVEVAFATCRLALTVWGANPEADVENCSRERVRLGKRRVRGTRREEELIVQDQRMVS